MSRIRPQYLLSALLLGFTVMAGASVGKLDTRTTFNIPAQPLSLSLRELANQAGIQILFEEQLVRDISAPAIRAQQSPLHVLSVLLKDTGLEFTAKDQTVAVRRKTMQTGADMASPRAAATMRIAQNSQSAQAQTSAPPGERKAQDVNEMEVSSSRIDGLNNRGVIPTGVDAPLYYNIIDRETIDRLGITTAEELFRFIPQTSSPETTLQNAPGFLSSGGGVAIPASTISLRGFSSTQTIILVNGRPLARTGRLNTQGTDINRIPVAAIERVEILPASASAMYGAGAIGGAINIIMRREYNRDSLTASIGTSTGGGADEHLLTYLNGMSFNEGRSQMTLTLDYRHRGALYANQRDYLDRIRARYPANTPVRVGTRSAFDQFVIGTFAGPQATIVLAGTGVPAGITDLGIPGAPGARYATVPLGTSPEASRALTPGSFTATAGLAGTGNRFGRISLYNPADDYTGDIQFEHQFSERLSAYVGANLRYSRADYSFLQVAGNGITLGVNDLRNPFRNAPGYQGRPVQVFIDPSDVPNSTTLNERTNARLTLGLKGEFTRAWGWALDVTGDQGEANINTSNGTNSFDALQSATAISPTSAAGQRLQALNGPGYTDVPANRWAVYPLLADHAAYPFNGNMDIWNYQRYSESRQRQLDVVARINGDLLQLPAGKWVASVNGQRTRFSTRSPQWSGTNAANARLTGATLYAASGSAGAQERTTDGLGFETVIPVIGKDWRPLPVDGVDLNFGMRRERIHSFGVSITGSGARTDYETQITTLVSGIKIQLVPDLAVRASFTEGVYPPDWDEITGNETVTIIDPATNALAAFYADSLRGNTVQTTPFEQLAGANPNLRIEQSESSNIGLIIRPRWLPGLLVTTDFWRTKKIDGISQVIFLDAFPRAGDYAQLFERNAPTPDDIARGWAGTIIRFNQRPINLAQIETDGADLNVRYDFDAGAAGAFFVNTNASFTNSFRTRVSADSPVFNTVGARPVRWRGYSSFNWTRGPLGMTLTGTYTGERFTNTTAPSAAFPTVTNNTGLDGDEIPSSLLWDTQFTYDTAPAPQATGLRGLVAGVRWTVGINNVFDKAPALVTDGTSFYNRYENPRQRYVYLRLRREF